MELTLRFKESSAPVHHKKTYLWALSRLRIFKKRLLDYHSCVHDCRQHSAAGGQWMERLNVRVRLRALWKHLCACCGCRGQARTPQSQCFPGEHDSLLWASWHILWALLGWAGRAQGMCFALPSQAVLARELLVQMWGVIARDPGQVVPAHELSASSSSWPGPGVHCSDSSRGEGYPYKGWGCRHFQSWCRRLRKRPLKTHRCFTEAWAHAAWVGSWLCQQCSVWFWSITS